MKGSTISPIGKRECLCDSAVVCFSYLLAEDSFFPLLFCCVDAASVVGLLRFFTFYLPLHTTPCTVVLLHGMPVFCTVDKETTVRTVRTVEAVGEKGVVGSLLSHILENNPIPTVLMNKCAIQKFRNPVSVPVVTTTC